MSEAHNTLLVIGAGLQGKAVVHDLDRSPLIGEIIAADLNVEGIKAFAARTGLEKVRCVVMDATDRKALQELIRSSGARAVVCMLPPYFGPSIARAAVDSGVHFVSSSYTGQVSELDGEARAKGVTILPEMGMDPGIDLLLAQRALAELDEVHGLYSYGTGLPEPCCADNPLRYKITWTFDGVLKAYKRPARFLRDGVEVAIPGTQIFRRENIHMVDVPGLGELEAYPNGDSIHYAEVFGLQKTIKTMVRYAMRYRGHCELWSVLADLGFLDDDEAAINGASISPRQFLVHHLTPRLQFQPDERDVVLVRIHTWGIKNGKKRTVIYDLTDYRDLQSGLFAMNRTVGYTTSIAAQLVLSGTITKTGVLSPVRDVPAVKVLDELQARGMTIQRSVVDS